MELVQNKDSKNELSINEDSDILAQYVVQEELNLSEITFKYISDVEKYLKRKIKWNYGDLVSFNKYRNTATFIIGKEGKLFNNLDYSKIGYLSVPSEITQYLDNAIYKYKDIELYSIDLRYDDDFIINYIGIIKEEWNFKFRYYSNYNLTVSFPNGKSHEFDYANTTASNIYHFYIGTHKLQDKIYISYSLNSTKYDEFFKKYKSIHNLTCNKEWTYDIVKFESGHKYENGDIYFYGPKESKDDVLNSIHTFFDGFHLEIHL